MHIIGIVVALIAGAAYWYWRLKSVRDVANDVGSMVGRVQGRMRMNKFRKQAEGSVLAVIDDPALAAAVYLYALAHEDRATLPLSEPVVRRELIPIVPAAELDEVVAYAQWAARDIADSRDVVRRFKPLWREQLTAEQRGDLLRMAEAVAGQGAADHSQSLSLEALRMALGFEPQR
ncbi:MAG: hypothetical protein EOP22_19110 [Hyphomicrobiales bacterium]|nr:MAG: hypothetical protein EOP22_19110 [Hyphomicrobiales bacterium]